MITNIYLIVFIFGVVGNILILAMSVCAFFILFAGINYIYFTDEKAPVAEQKAVAAKKSAKKFSILLVILIFFNIVIPDKKDVVAFFSLRQVDSVVNTVQEYNNKTPDSIYILENALKLVDETIKKASQANDR